MKAFVRHLRKKDDEMPFATVVVLDNGAFGWAICRRDKDSYSKKIGRKIATERALLSIRDLQRYEKLTNERLPNFFIEKPTKRKTTQLQAARIIRAIAVAKEIKHLEEKMDKGELSFKAAVDV